MYKHLSYVKLKTRLSSSTITNSRSSEVLLRSRGRDVFRGVGTILVRTLECPKLQAFFKKMFLKIVNCIISFAKIISPVKENRTKREFSPIFI